MGHCLILQLLIMIGLLLLYLSLSLLPRFRQHSNTIRSRVDLPHSPNKKGEIKSSLATKFKLRILPLQKKTSGREYQEVNEEQQQFIRLALDHPEISTITPGRKDNVYVGKSDGKRQYMQNRYLLWPLKDTLDIVNGCNISNDITAYKDKFGSNLSFAIFYRFLKMHKEYVFNKKINRNSCLCEICENVMLVAKGMRKACVTCDTPIDPHS